MVRRRRVAKILHDERAVSEDVDHVSNVNSADLVHLLSLLVRVGRTENITNLSQNARLRARSHSQRIRSKFMFVGPLGLSRILTHDQDLSMILLLSVRPHKIHRIGRGAQRPTHLLGGQEKSSQDSWLFTCRAGR